MIRPIDGLLLQLPIFAFSDPIPARARGYVSLLSPRRVPPFCVSRGGIDGAGSSPQDCRYSDYQACLQAAANLRGNCVQNIEYHGDTSERDDASSAGSDNGTRYSQMIKSTTRPRLCDRRLICWPVLSAAC